MNPAARTIRAHRRNTGSRWRRLEPAQQVLLVLVHLRKGETFTQVAAGFEVGTTTAWRYAHEARATRVWKIAERVKASVLLGLGDKGYVRLPVVVFCPFKGRGRPQWKKDANSDHAKLRSPGERAFAQLENRDVLRQSRCCPHRAGEIARAVLALQLREAG